MLIRLLGLALAAILGLGPVRPAAALLALRDGARLPEPRGGSPPTRRKGPPPRQPGRSGSKFTPIAQVIGSVHFRVHVPTRATILAPGRNATPADVPPDAAVAGPRGAVLFLHACLHHSQDFFELPEESKMATAALRRGLAVLAPDASPSQGGCWNPQIDGPLLYNALPLLLQKEGLLGKPLYGVGISSGGVMLDALVGAFRIKFDGLQFQVSPGSASGDIPGYFRSQPHPRSSFVFMTGDQYAPRRTIEVAAAALRKAGTPAQVLEAKPKPIRELVNRAPLVGLSRGFMRRTVRRMYDLGYLERRPGGAESEGGRLATPAVAGAGPPPVWIKLGKSDAVVGHLLADANYGPKLYPRLRAFNEEVHVVEGVHGPTSEHFEESLDFILGL